MTWLLCRVTRAITQVILAYRYCAFCDADFTARYIAYGGVLFSSDICALSQVLFMARYSRYKAGSFDPPL